MVEENKKAVFEIINLNVSKITFEINRGDGTLGRLIRDTILAENLNQTLINLKNGSKGLDENMTAVKQNFFFKGYFERKAKEADAKKEALEKDIEEK